jgi:hypothetical protein
VQLLGQDSQRISRLSRFTDAGQQPPHYLPVWIATGGHLLHSLLGKGPGLVFGLSLILRERHPLANDFSPRIMFRLHLNILCNNK